MNITNKPYNSNLSWKKNDYDKIKGVCIHIAQGSNLDGWAINPNNKSSSWHYCIFKNGEIHSYVPESHFAFCQGMSWNGTTPINPRGVAINRNKLAQIILDNQGHNPNDFLIGIEHEGMTGEPWTDAMYKSDAELCIDIAKRNGFAPDRYHIIGHFEIDPIDRPNCPGTGFNFNRLLEEINKIQNPVVIDEYYRVFKNGKQIGAYKIEQNAFDKFLNGKGDKVTYKNKDITSNFTSIMKQINELTSQVKSLSEKLNKALADLKVSQTTATAYKQSITSLETDISSIKELHEEQVGEFQKEIQNNENVIQSLTNEVAKLQAEVKGYEEANKNQSVKIEAQAKQITALQSKLEKINNDELIFNFSNFIKWLQKKLKRKP